MCSGQEEASLYFIIPFLLNISGDGISMDFKVSLQKLS